MNVVATGLTKNEAIYVEQMLISTYTLDYLINARREIAKRNIYRYTQYYGAALEILSGIPEDIVNSYMER